MESQYIWGLAKADKKISIGHGWALYIWGNTSKLWPNFKTMEGKKNVIHLNPNPWLNSEDYQLPEHHWIKDFFHFTKDFFITTSHWLVYHTRKMAWVEENLFKHF